ncbi:Uncharacterised protein [Serratia plymuthica]|uniref:Uncharacterized protein n=1 Tax=Serratia plymuthica TaxID=82996 RepID=A0A2X4VF33_SERPL|nr:Uncharacterised protein [Serratia plymuthica]
MTILPDFGLMIDTHSCHKTRPIMTRALISLFQRPEQDAGTLRERVCGTLRRAIHNGTLSVGSGYPHHGFWPGI